MTDDPCISLSEVTYSYDDGTRALDGIDLEVRRGERVGLLGPNGAGKSTLLRLVAGLTTPASGTVEVLGNDPSRRGALKGGNIGFLFQDPEDQVFMPRVEDDIAFGPINMGLSGEEVDVRVREAVERTGLGGFEDRVPHHLSLGEKKRVALAGIIAMRPEILLLDEPTANLDLAGRTVLMDIIDSLGCTVIVATHEVDTALRMAYRFVVIDGKVIRKGTAREIFTDPGLLSRSQLAVPEVARPFIRLASEGLWDGPIPLTSDEVVDAIRMRSSGE